MKIIKVHGCSGAGKTTAVRKFMELCSIVTPIPGLRNGTRPHAYMCSLTDFAPIYVLGNYDNVCGGMDTIGAAETAMRMVDEFAPKGHVVFEGLLQSTYYGAMGLHSMQYGPRYIYAFLDTPVEVCLERVVIRRSQTGAQNKFNPQLTRDKWKTINNLRRKLEIAGDHTVKVIDHTGDVGRQIAEMLR